MAIYFRAKRDAIDYRTGFPVAKGELLTPTQRYFDARNIEDAIFDVVEISRKKTCISTFGARFEIKE